MNFFKSFSTFLTVHVTSAMGHDFNFSFNCDCDSLHLEIYDFLTAHIIV